MNASPFYIAAVIVALAVVALLVFVVDRKRKGQRLTTLAGLAFGCILAGIFFGDERPIGYSLLGAGLILAIADIIRKSKAPNNYGPPSTSA
jgi:uncharacterized membrane protein HdeD (DUF308 family)